MITKCSVGDLAFINNALRTTNIGRVVTCKECLGYHEYGAKLIYNTEVWASPASDYIWVVSGNIETQYGPSKESLIADLWLTPIKADPNLVEEKNKELEEV